MPKSAGFGLYIHWPFCTAKCPYCDFNSHVSSSIDQGRWQNALLSELARSADETGPRVLNSVFFGGGTPSLMDPETVGLLINQARSLWSTSNDMEITLEANPTSVEAGRFQAFRDAGVNRVSVGVQSLNDRDLKALGRRHTSSEALDALEIAKNTFDRVSFDLIYARQNQSLSDWKAELLQALEFATDHLSLYQLSVEAGTAFGDRFARGKLNGLPNEDLAADMFSLTQELTLNAGFPAYETSNHAKPGAESHHNLIYWRAGDWVGIGPGAHGRLTIDSQRIATETHLQPGVWLTSVETAGSGESARSEISPTEVAEEALLMGLRLAEGVDRELLVKLDISLSKVNSLVDFGVLECPDNRARTTAKGRPILNAILKDLLT
jgi:putative oxygen-independent coproporphyrinogen III oxidase